jgi:hypothetical protein
MPDTVIALRDHVSIGYATVDGGPSTYDANIPYPDLCVRLISPAYIQQDLLYLDPSVIYVVQLVARSALGVTAQLWVHLNDVLVVSPELDGSVAWGVYTALFQPTFPTVVLSIAAHTGDVFVTQIAVAPCGTTEPAGSVVTIAPLREKVRNGTMVFESVEDSIRPARWMYDDGGTVRPAMPRRRDVAARVCNGPSFCPAVAAYLVPPRCVWRCGASTRGNAACHRR